MGMAVYATFAMLISGISGMDEASIEPLFALLGCGLVALLAFGAGVTREAGLWPSLRHRLGPLSVRRSRAVGAGVAFLLACSGVLLLVSLAIHFGTALGMLHGLSPGLVGNMLMLIVGVAYIPNALIWGVGYLSGVGFSIGEATSVAPGAVTAGALPSFPLFSAIPGSGSWFFLIVLLIPIAAGGVVTVVADPRARKLFAREAVVERLTLIGLLAAAIFGLCLAGDGGLGAARLTHVGPTAWSTAGAVFVLALIGSFATDAFRVLNRRREGRASSTESGTTPQIDLTSKVIGESTKK